jgi:hypothetical protein
MRLRGKHWRRLFALGMVLAVAGASAAHAAGGAYAVDTADVSSPDNCKVESWFSAAGNRDIFAAVAPGCVFNVLRPVEFSSQVALARADGDWSGAVTPKLKTNLVPTGIGMLGLAISATAGFDLRTGNNTSVALTVPVTLRFSENARIIVNARLAVRPARRPELLHLRRRLRRAQRRQRLHADRRSVRPRRRGR